MFAKIVFVAFYFVKLVTSQELGSGGFSCFEKLCKNGGSCFYTLQKCLCQPGYFGNDCGHISGLRNLHPFGRMILFEIQQNHTFAAAADECMKWFGRILSTEVIVDELSISFGVPTKLFEIRQGFWSDSTFSRISAQFWESSVLAEMNRRFWITERSYSPHKPIKPNCTLLELNGSLTNYPCSQKHSVACVTPRSGPCYPEVAKRYCQGGACTQNMASEIPGVSCFCRAGFELNTTGVCADVDECATQNVSDCYYSTICQNTYGSYRCGCHDNKQGNGNDTCTYLLTLQHKNINFTEIDATLENTSRTVLPRNEYFTWAKTQLQTTVENVFSNATVTFEKVVVKVLNLTSYDNASATYDVHVNDDGVSTTSLLEFYREMDRRNELGWLKGSDVYKAPTSCTETILRQGKDIIANFFTFPAATPGNVVGSKEKCPNGRSKATAECRMKRDADGKYTAYFDYATVATTPCEFDSSSWANQFQENKSPQTVQGIVSDLNVLTADYTNTSQDVVDEAVETLKEVADYVWNSDVEISVDTMRGVMNIANNIRNSQKHNRKIGKDFVLNSFQRRDMIRSLERCSEKVDVGPSQQITMNTDSLKLQVSNVVFNSSLSESEFSDGIFFRDTTIIQQSDGPETQAVQAAINGDVLSRAIRLKEKSQRNSKSLQVSVMYFTDSEFFPSNSYGAEVEQILSLRVSDLKLDNLERPIWFQIPPKQRKANATHPEMIYYKCANLNEETGEWLSDGCQMMPGSNPPNCTCDHMTNFAVLVQVHPQLKIYTLEVFGKIFCVVSIIGLSLTLFIHLYFPSLRSSQVVKIHCHLTFCLLALYIILLTSIERPKPHGSCIASALILHFTLLSSWGWMFVECVTMYKKLVTVFSFTSPHYVCKCALLVYGVSAVIAILTFLIAVVGYDNNHFAGWSNPESDFVPSSYLSDRLCWLQSYSLIIGFLVPVGDVFLANLIGSVVIFRAITWGRQNITSRAKNKADFKVYFVRMITISVLLGLGWVFAIPLTVSDDSTVNAVFGWLFTIINALQGFFIFLFFCVTREDVQKLWSKELKKFFKDFIPKKTSELSNSKTKDIRETPTHTSCKMRQTQFEPTSIDREKAEDDAENLEFF